MSLRKHATSLALMHTADVLQPLLILPYAARVLGPLEFGQFAYAMAIGQIAATIVEYGFYWTGQRAAAAAQREPAVISALVADVTATKTVLCLVVVAAGLAAANALSLSMPLLFATMLAPVGGILFPAWLFIALERAWQAAIAVVLGRILALVLFLAAVTSPDRVGLAVAIQSGIPLVSGLISLPFVCAIGFGGFRTVTLWRIVTQLKSGWRGFLYTLTERALVTLPVPIVGHFAGYVAAGQYSVAEKFVGGTRPFFRVVSETFLPRVAYSARHDPAAGVSLIWTSLSTLVFGAALSLSLFFLAPYIILILFGNDFAAAIPIVRLMSVLPILMNANTCTSNLYMFNYGHERAWASLNVVGLMTFLIAAYVLCLFIPNAAIAVALAVIARESVVLIVSAGFFLAFAVARRRASQAHRADDALPAHAALFTRLARRTRAVFSRRDQVRI